MEGITWLFISLAGSSVLAFPSFDEFMSDEPWPSLPICSRMNEPCDYAYKTMIQSRDSSGNVQPEQVIFEANTETCTCPGRQSCPKGWVDAPGRSITRALLSTGKKVEYKMNYCEQLPQLEICLENQIAVRMSGMPYPDEIETVNCTCPGNNYNLHLKRAYMQFGSSMRVVHEFVCEMRTCNMNTSDRRTCKKRRRGDITEYRCLCPDDYDCHMEPGERRGYCEPRKQK